jgi:hypothetical protein
MHRPDTCAVRQCGEVWIESKLKLRKPSGRFALQLNKKTVSPKLAVFHPSSFIFYPFAYFILMRHNNMDSSYPRISP